MKPNKLYMSVVLVGVCGHCSYISNTNLSRLGIGFCVDKKDENEYTMSLAIHLDDITNFLDNKEFSENIMHAKISVTIKEADKIKHHINNMITKLSQWIKRDNVCHHTGFYCSFTQDNCIDYSIDKLKHNILALIQSDRIFDQDWIDFTSRQ